MLVLIGGIVIADTIKESEMCLQLAEKYDQLFCTIGVHPHAASEWKSEDAKWIMEQARGYRNVVALGEMGLDYYYDNSPRDVQQSVFREQTSS